MVDDDHLILGYNGNLGLFIYLKQRKSSRI